MFQVPATTIARNVRAARSEGSAARGIKRARKLRDKNATRDLEYLFQQFGLALKVPRETLSHQESPDKQVIELPWIRPSAGVKFLLERHPVLLLGTEKKLAEQLSSFWSLYQAVQPGHDVFKDATKLSCTIPMLLHGDEGRYLKRSNFMICTIESVFGSNPQPRQPCSCNCSEDPVLERYSDLEVYPSAELARAVRVAEKQKNNVKGHCFLSRFLCFGMASKHYKENPGLLHKAFELVSNDLRDLFHNGVEVAGQHRFYVAVLGVKGDLKFHHQVGHLSRSYYNLGKKRANTICHLCAAGGPNIPFECLADQPAWESTFLLEEPWRNPDSPPALASIPYDAAGKAALFKLDIFHLWKTGQGRDVCGSCIVVLARLGKFDFEPDTTKNIEDRLARAHACFRLWCEATSRTAALRSFTKNNLMCPDMSSFSWGNFKGSDTTLVTKWLLFFLRTQMVATPEYPQRLLRAMVSILESAVTFYGVLYSHDLWLSRKCGQRVQHHLLRMLRGYKVCAEECCKLQLAGFGLKPKLHALHHICKDLEYQLRTKAPLVLSPLVYNCEGNEDAVGQVSRLARRVSARTVSSRVFDRIMFKTKALIRRKFGGRHGRKQK